MRRYLLVLGVVGVFGLLLLSRGGGSASSAPVPSAITVGSVLPPETMRAMAGDLQMPSLPEYHLTVRGHFEQSGYHFTILTAPGARTAVSSSDLASAAARYAGLTKQQFPVRLREGDQEAKPLFGLQVRGGELERLVVFLKDGASIGQLKAEVDPLNGDAVPFTVRSPDDTGKYVASFISPENLGPNPRGVSQFASATYVQVCLSVLGVEPSAEAQRQLSGPPWRDELTLIGQAGRASVCNGLGKAMSFRRAGIDHPVYVAATTVGFEPGYSQLQAVQIVVNRSTYNALA
ncbi:MAG TPA: hypothetical protein VMT30_00495 [Candidatus Saccharimonadia bacterium]|nr:hypothetical protein [Candidatus Saccharimonadia bacterium]